LERTRDQRHWRWPAPLNMALGGREMSLPDLSLIVGNRIANIALVEPVSWWFGFEGGARLRADSLWRIVSDGRVKLTSTDHDQQFGLPARLDARARAIELLSSNVVKTACIRADTGDVVLTFDNNSKLEVFITSCGYESWHLFLPTHAEAIGVGGGEVVTYMKYDV
jgi:hypothetical protein